MRRHDAGFTLVEVLVALLLMAVMSAMAWRGLDAMLRSRDMTQESIDRSAVLQTALAQWEQDWEQIQDSGLIVPAQSFEGQRLRLTRRHPQGLQVVSWYVQDGELCRWASPPVTRLAELRRAWERSEQPLTLASQRLVVLSGVSDWQLYYFWDNAWANALSTGGEAPPTPKEIAPPPTPGPPGTPGTPPPAQAEQRGQPIPNGVRLQLQFGPGSGYSGTLTRQIVVAGST
jgi:general secretion pathway protein J